MTTPENDRDPIERLTGGRFYARYPLWQFFLMLAVIAAVGVWSWLR